MGGFFGVASKKDCMLDVFFGVDYHSHLGTRRAGMAAWDREIGLQRQIQKQKRLKELMEVQRGISLAYNESRLGTVERVLVDGFSEDMLICRSEFESPEVDGEILVPFQALTKDGRTPQSFVGEFLTVRITGADEYDLQAEVI